jgi:hypothetical protein
MDLTAYSNWHSCSKTDQQSQIWSSLSRLYTVYSGLYTSFGMMHKEAQNRDNGHHILCLPMWKDLLLKKRVSSPSYFIHEPL